MFVCLFLFFFVVPECSFALIYSPGFVDTCTRFQVRVLKSKAKCVQLTRIERQEIPQTKWNERRLLPSLLPLTTTKTFSFTFLSWALASRPLSFCTYLPRLFLFFFAEHKIIWTSPSAVAEFSQFFSSVHLFPKTIVWIFNQLISWILFRPNHNLFIAYSSSSLHIFDSFYSSIIQSKSERINFLLGENVLFSGWLFSFHSSFNTFHHRICFNSAHWLHCKDFVVSMANGETKICTKKRFFNLRKTFRALPIRLKEKLDMTQKIYSMNVDGGDEGSGNERDGKWKARASADGPKLAMSLCFHRETRENSWII